MPNTPEKTTLGTRPQWIDEFGKKIQNRSNTQQLFLHGGGTLVVRDRLVEEQFNVNPECQLTDRGPETQTTTMQPQPAPKPIPRVQRVRTLPDERYILLKKYEGFVQKRGEDSFNARFFENNNDYPVLDAEFSWEELSEVDRKLAVEGAPIVWTIGYRYEGSTRKRESVMYLRRLPQWSEKEIVKAREEYRELIRGIDWK